MAAFRADNCSFTILEDSASSNQRIRRTDETARLMIESFARSVFAGVPITGIAANPSWISSSLGLLSMVILREWIVIRPSCRPGGRKVFTNTIRGFHHRWISSLA